MIGKLSKVLYLLAILVFLSVPGGVQAAVSGPRFSLEGTFFTHLSTTQNTSSGASSFYNVLASSNSNAVVLETQNWTAPGTPDILNYDPHPTGLFFNSTLFGGSYWGVINEDASAMPVGIGFNVAVITNTSRAFMVVANTNPGGNTGGNVTTITNPLTDGHPEVMPIISQFYNPGGSSFGIYNPHPVGVWYTGTHWAIFNEDLAAIPNGAAFDVYVPTGNVFKLSSTTANTSLGYDLKIDNPLLNNHPDALAFVTQVFGSSGVYNNHEPGIWYTGNNKWVISNADNTQLPLNSSFFVWVPTEQDSVLIQKSATANIVASQIRLDDNRLNSDPNLLLLATSNYSPGGLTGVVDDSPLSVSYNLDGHYRINNDNGAAMPAGTAFNVYSPGISPRSWVQVVNGGILPSGDTRFSNPFLDNNPTAIFFITANDTPFGASGYPADNHPTSVFYDTASGFWSIVNTDGTTMPPSMAFNIFIPPASMAPFTVVSSALNTSGNTVYINNLRSNHHPIAALIVTQVKTALSSHNIGVKYDPVQAEWGIFNKDGSAMAPNMAFNVLVLTPAIIYLPLIVR